MRLKEKGRKRMEKMGMEEQGVEGERKSERRNYECKSQSRAIYECFLSIPSDLKRESNTCTFNRISVRVEEREKFEPKLIAESILFLKRAAKKRNKTERRK